MVSNTVKAGAPIGINFWGGPVITTGINVYPIWYGAWDQTSKDIIINFINSLGPKNADVATSVRKWWKINGLYYNASGAYPSQSIVVPKQVTDNYSFEPLLSKINCPKGLFLMTKMEFILSSPAQMLL